MSDGRDRVDAILDQWARERPELPTAPMEAIGRLSRLALILGSKIHEGHKPFGLSRESFDVLAALRRAGAPYRLTPTELYRSLMLSSGAMTNRIDRLEHEGMVERVDDPRDRRGVLVALTAKGHKTIDDAMDAHVENEAVLIAAITPQEREALCVILRKLLLSLE